MEISRGRTTRNSRSGPAGGSDQRGWCQEEDKYGKRFDIRRQLLGQESYCRILKPSVHCHDMQNASSRPAAT